MCSWGDRAVSRWRCSCDAPGRHGRGVKMDMLSCIVHLLPFLFFLCLVPLRSGKAESRPQWFSGRALFGGYQGRPPTRFLLLTDWDEPPRPGRPNSCPRGPGEQVAAWSDCTGGSLSGQGTLRSLQCSAAEQTPDRAAGPLGRWADGREGCQDPRVPEDAGGDGFQEGALGQQVRPHSAGLSPGKTGPGRRN